MTDQEKKELEERLYRINYMIEISIQVIRKAINTGHRKMSEEEKKKIFATIVDEWLDLEEERFAIKDKLKQASDSSES